jgi:hypothetical protein
MRNKLEKSKFLILRKTTIGLDTIGTSEGIVQTIEYGPKGMVITTQCGNCIQLKVPKKSFESWRKVIMTLIK